MRRGILPVVFLALALLNCIPCYGQGRRPGNAPSSSRTYSISGSLRNPDGHTMEMVRVDLKKPTGEPVATKFTRSNGEFDFENLTSGVYIIAVAEEGFEPINENVEIYHSSRSGISLFLKRPLELHASESGETVSARELSLPRKAREAMQEGRQRLYEKQDAEGGLAQFQRAAAEAPSYYEAYHQMGIAYMRLGQMADAEQALRKSVELSEGRSADVHFTLSELLSNNQRFAEAEPLARLGLDLNPNSWQGHYELARALLGLNRLEAAEKSALEARMRNPNFAPLHLLLANIHIHKHDYTALLQDLDSFLKLEPNGPASEQARQTREQIQHALAKAQNVPAAASPNP